MYKFGLIGFPLGHSISKVIHEAGFKSLGVDATYDVLETPPDDLVDRIKYLKSNGYDGFNVTIPLKLPVSLFVTGVDRYADLARAVNTIKIEPDKSMLGYNTDVIGFRKAIEADFDGRGVQRTPMVSKPGQGCEPSIIQEDVSLLNKKVAILGTGGAAHAAAVAFSEMGVKEVVFFTRNIPNSLATMDYMRRKLPNVAFNVYQIEQIRDLSDYAMLVNTTPVGMLGKAADLIPVSYNVLSTMQKDAIVYDVVYNPRVTLLLKAAEELGLKTVNGLDMLIYQAAAAQEIWLGKKPNITAMKIAALEAL